VVALRTLLFTILVPGTVTVLFPWFLLRSGSELFAFDLGDARFLGGVAIACGALLYTACAWAFSVHGRGTPAPYDPPRRLVIRGPYRWCRNPMYLAVPLVLVGEGLWFGSGTLLVYAAILVLGFQLRVVYWEEPTLRRAFGASYDRYCETVPRWLPHRPRRERGKR
jgi:protein-S-isoprenylcysteine O-methyltransferase Ste14